MKISVLKKNIRCTIHTGGIAVSGGMGGFGGQCARGPSGTEPDSALPADVRQYELRAGGQLCFTAAKTAGNANTARPRGRRTVEAAALAKRGTADGQGGTMRRENHADGGYTVYHYTDGSQRVLETVMPYDENDKVHGVSKAIIPTAN